MQLSNRPATLSAPSTGTEDVFCKQIIAQLASRAGHGLLVGASLSQASVILHRLQAAYLKSATACAILIKAVPDELVQGFEDNPWLMQFTQSDGSQFEITFDEAIKARPLGVATLAIPESALTSMSNTVGLYLWQCITWSDESPGGVKVQLLLDDAEKVYPPNYLRGSISRQPRDVRIFGSFSEIKRGFESSPQHLVLTRGARVGFDDTSWSAFVEKSDAFDADEAQLYLRNPAGFIQTGTTRPR